MDDRIARFDFGPRVIWRVLPDAMNPDLWCVELRDVDSKTVSFAVISQKETRVVWDRMFFVADWWSVTVGFVNGFLLLENYGSPDIPAPTDLFGISVEKGEVEWALPGYKFGEAVDREVIRVRSVNSISAGEERFISLTSGLWIDGPEKQALIAPARFHFHVYTKEENYFPDFERYIRSNSVSDGDIRLIEYLESGAYMLVCYYIWENELVKQYLIIHHRLNGVIWNEMMDEESAAEAQSNVMYFNGRVLAARRQKKQLLLIRLEDS